MCDAHMMPCTAPYAVTSTLREFPQRPPSLQLDCYQGPPQHAPQMQTSQQPIVQGSSAQPQNSRRRKPHATWVPINPRTQYSMATGLPTYAPGWSMNVYNTDHTHYFRLPSETVLMTKGSQKYIQLFNSHGPYLKYRFQLCWEHLTGGCRFGERCSFIHCVSMSGVEVTDVHYNAPEATQQMHAPGSVLNVFFPNTSTESDSIPTEAIAVTQGSISATSPETSGWRRPHHCAHFLFNHLCTRGSLCNFIHVVVGKCSMRAVPQHLIPAGSEYMAQGDQNGTEGAYVAQME